ncbi:hypothetical protein [Microvirga sp. 2TAF3]|uniref:hypothetical protein n=1 Tax=Microvirga sp. 2TAF3 TaxID=3233014 RepID=UPI003F99C4CD
MADQKNESGKSPSDQKNSGAASGSGAKISAGTSLGNVGETPMPHAQEGAKSAQSSTLASNTSKPHGGQATDRDRPQDQSSRDVGLTDKAQQVASEAGERVREAAGQAREKAGEAYENASDWAQDTYERASHWASDRYQNQQERLGQVRERSAKTFGRARNSVQSYVSENPMVVGLVGLAAGLLLGALLPRTRRENETFGELADEVRNQGLRYARDATQRGREYVEEAFNGDDPRFSKHESEFRQNRPDVNPH